VTNIMVVLILTCNIVNFNRWVVDYDI